MLSLAGAGIDHDSCSLCYIAHAPIRHRLGNRARPRERHRLCVPRSRRFDLYRPVLDAISRLVDVTAILMMMMMVR